MVIESSREWLGIQWVKITLYFHLREKIDKRLHNGLSDMVLVNTLTDVRELKKQQQCFEQKVLYLHIDMV